MFPVDLGSKFSNANTGVSVNFHIFFVLFSSANEVYSA